MIRQESINRTRITRKTSTFRMEMGGLAVDGKTDVVEGGAIGDESLGGLVSVRGR